MATGGSGIGRYPLQAAQEQGAEVPIAAPNPPIRSSLSRRFGRAAIQLSDSSIAPAPIVDPTPAAAPPLAAPTSVSGAVSIEALRARLQGQRNAFERFSLMRTQAAPVEASVERVTEPTRDEEVRNTPESSLIVAESPPSRDEERVPAREPILYPEQVRIETPITGRILSILTPNAADLEVLALARGEGGSFPEYLKALMNLHSNRIDRVSAVRLYGEIRTVSQIAAILQNLDNENLRALKLLSIKLLIEDALTIAEPFNEDNIPQILGEFLERLNQFRQVYIGLPEQDKEAFRTRLYQEVDPSTLLFGSPLQVALEISQATLDGSRNFGARVHMAAQAYVELHREAPVAPIEPIVTQVQRDRERQAPSDSLWRPETTLDALIRDRLAGPLPPLEGVDPAQIGAGIEPPDRFYAYIARACIREVVTSREDLSRCPAFLRHLERPLVLLRVLVSRLTDEERASFLARLPSDERPVSDNAFNVWQATRVIAERLIDEPFRASCRAALRNPLPAPVPIAPIVPEPIAPERIEAPAPVEAPRLSAFDVYARWVAFRQRVEQILPAVGAVQRMAEDPEPEQPDPDDHAAITERNNILRTNNARREVSEESIRFHVALIRAFRECLQDEEHGADYARLNADITDPNFFSMQAKLALAYYMTMPIQTVPVVFPDYMTINQIRAGQIQIGETSSIGMDSMNELQVRFHTLVPFVGEDLEGQILNPLFVEDGGNGEAPPAVEVVGRGIWRDYTDYIGRLTQRNRLFMAAVQSAALTVQPPEQDVL